MIFPSILNEKPSKKLFIYAEGLPFEEELLGCQLHWIQIRIGIYFIN